MAPPVITIHNAGAPAVPPPNVDNPAEPTQNEGTPAVPAPNMGTAGVPPQNMSAPVAPPQHMSTAATIMHKMNTVVIPIQQDAVGGIYAIIIQILGRTGSRGNVTQCKVEIAGEQRTITRNVLGPADEGDGLRLMESEREARRVTEIFELSIHAVLALPYNVLVLDQNEGKAFVWHPDLLSRPKRRVLDVDPTSRGGPKDSSYAYVTLLTKPAYLPGILVLDHGLRSTGSRYPLVVMVTPGLSKEARDVLRKRNIRMRDVDPLRPASASLASAPHSHDERFADTWTKLRVFQLFEFRRVVLLDCDMIIKRNMDDLFQLDLEDDQIAATYVCACNPRKFKHYPADWKPENCAYSAYSRISALPPHGTKDAPRPHTQLNSGTVVLNPSKKLSDALVDFFSTNDKVLTYSFPDQDLLSAYFDRRWKLIPWYYNALRTLRYVHPDLWDDEQVRCVHYILSDKPWQSRRTPDEHVEHFGLLNDWWWQQFDEMARTMESMDPEGWKLLLRYVDVSM